MDIKSSICSLESVPGGIKVLNHKNNQLCMIKKISWFFDFGKRLRKISQSLTEVCCIWNNYQERLSERYFYFWKSHTDIFCCRWTNDRQRGEFHTLNVKIYLEIIGQGPKLKHCNVWCYLIKNDIGGFLQALFNLVMFSIFNLDKIPFWYFG